MYVLWLSLSVGQTFKLRPPFFLIFDVFEVNTEGKLIIITIAIISHCGSLWATEEQLNHILSSEQIHYTVFFLSFP